jgi:hypothetical protein
MALTIRWIYEMGATNGHQGLQSDRHNHD